MDEKILKQKQYQEKFYSTHEGYNKTYYETHKQDIMNSIMIPVECSCGFTCAKTNLKRHQKSKLHLKKLNSRMPFPKGNEKELNDVGVYENPKV